MTTINLRDYYPWYTEDEYIEVSNEIFAAVKDAERQERNCIRRAVYNNAHYSLDCGDGIEHDARFVSLLPCEIYERKITKEQLYSARAALPDKQRRRVYAHYTLGVTQTEIARAEGVSVNVVSSAIKRGLKN